jgi:hypothetical protein
MWVGTYEVAECARLQEKSRSSMAYDFGTPNRYHCVAREGLPAGSDRSVIN